MFTQNERQPSGCRTLEYRRYIKMDDRLKYIGEHLEEMLIGPDEKFRFHCTQCGKCCINREDILLNPKDLYNIAATLSISQEEAVEQYCETYMGGTSRLPIVRLRPQGSTTSFRLRH